MNGPKTAPERAGQRRLRAAILDDYLGVARSSTNWSELDRHMDITVFDRHLGDVDEAAEVLEPFDVLCLIRERMPMPRELIERLPNLRLINFTGQRNPSLDLTAATERGITVCHTTPSEGYPTLEVAWGLILTLTRNLHEEIPAMREGGWQRTVGTGLEGKTLGLVGVGTLGSRMVPIARAFGMNVIAWSPHLTSQRAEAAGATAVNKVELFETADIVSVHMVLSDVTRHLVGAAELRRMKPDGLLINTSRGGLLDEKALLSSLQEGSIGGAGLDVFEIEPLPDDHPLRSSSRVALTPHLGYCTHESFALRFGQTVENVMAWLRDDPIRVKNPESRDWADGGPRG